MVKSNKELIKEVIEELGKMNLLKAELLNPYQKMEKLLYMNEIAEEFQVDISTIKRNKNRLINEIVHIFITEKELKKLTEI